MRGALTRVGPSRLCCSAVSRPRRRIVDNPPVPGQPLTLEQVVYLNQVLGILQQHPEVTRLEIQGHTSSEGGYDDNMP